MPASPAQPCFRAIPQTLGGAASLFDLAVCHVPARGVWAIRWIGRTGQPTELEYPIPEPASSSAAAPALGNPRTAAATTPPPASPSSSPLPSACLASDERDGTRAAVRSGRRVPGQVPRFPSAALVLSHESAGAWIDCAYVDESFDTEIGAVALATFAGAWLIAYLARSASGQTSCRIAVVPRDRSAHSALGSSGQPTWRSLPAYPQAPGRAGAMAGAHGSVLIVAGGANFPDLPPWEGGIKRYYDDIYVLLPGETQWRAGGRLPAARAYGCALSTPDGVLILGGEDPAQVFDDSLLLSWNGAQLTVKPGPALPEPTTSASAVILGEAVYLAGGYTPATPRISRRDFWRLAWKQAGAAWERRETWPGPARALAVMAAAPQDDALYLMSGLEVRPAGEEPPAAPYLKDAYRYRPTAGWERLPDLPWSVVAATSPAPVAAQPSQVFVLGGVDGTQVGKLPRESPLPDDILVFNVARNEWKLWPEAWPTPVVTVPAVALGDEWVMISGEIRPGKRTAEVWAWRPDRSQKSP